MVSFASPLPLPFPSPVPHYFIGTTHGCFLRPVFVSLFDIFFVSWHSLFEKVLLKSVDSARPSESVFAGVSRTGDLALNMLRCHKQARHPVAALLCRQARICCLPFAANCPWFNLPRLCPQSFFATTGGLLPIRHDSLPKEAQQHDVAIGQALLTV